MAQRSNMTSEERQPRRRESSDMAIASAFLKAFTTTASCRRRRAQYARRCASFAAFQLRAARAAHNYRHSP